VQGYVDHLAVCTEDSGHILLGGLTGNAGDEELALVGPNDLSELDDDRFALLREGGGCGFDERRTSEAGRGG
jgi:hypothetical protein